MPDRRYRVFAVATHPVQYMTPIFRRMATHPSLDFQVAYCALRGAEVGHDPEFGASIQWDVPVLDGHSWTHVPNRGSGAESFFGLRNPALWKLIRDGNLLNSEAELRHFFSVNMVLGLIIVSLGIAQAILGHSFLNPAIVAEDIRDLSTLYRVSPISQYVAVAPLPHAYRPRMS
jgi:hypothetical protein